MPPSFKIVNQLISKLFVGTPRLDNAVGLTTSEIDAQDRVVGILVEICLRLRPVDDAVADAGLETSQSAPGIAIQWSLNPGGQSGHSPALGRFAQPRHESTPRIT